MGVRQWVVDYGREQNIYTLLSNGGDTICEKAVLSAIWYNLSDVIDK